MSKKQVNNIYYTTMIEQLAREAPTMSVKIANEIANKIQGYFNDYYYNATCFALIAERILGGSERITKMIEGETRPGVKTALKQARYLTGWVECGPCQGDPWEKLDTELAKENT